MYEYEEVEREKFNQFRDIGYLKILRNSRLFMKLDTLYGQLLDVLINMHIHTTQREKCFNSHSTPNLNLTIIANNLTNHRNSLYRRLYIWNSRKETIG